MSLCALAIACLLLVATALGYIALQMVRPPAPPPVAEAAPPMPEPPARARLLVATRQLPVGTLIKDEDFTVREIHPRTCPEPPLG